MYMDCKSPDDKEATVIPDDIIVPYNGTTIAKCQKISREKIAALVFDQCLEVKYVLLRDLVHRFKCLSYDINLL